MPWGIRAICGLSLAMLLGLLGVARAEAPPTPEDVPTAPLPEPTERIESLTDPQQKQPQQKQPQQKQPQQKQPQQKQPQQQTKQQQQPQPQQPQPQQPQQPQPQQATEGLLDNPRSITIGNIDGGQLAVRGSLIVAATRAGLGSKVPGGVHVIDASGSALKEVFVAKSPEGFVASGVALSGDVLTYSLTRPTGVGKVVRLGVDGSFRWTRDFERPLRSLPIAVPASISGGFEQVAVLVEDPTGLLLTRLDGERGMLLSQDTVRGCKQGRAGRVYAIPEGVTRSGVTRPAGLLVWCEQSRAGTFNLFPNTGKSTSFVTPFEQGPQLMLVEGMTLPELPGIAAAPLSEEPLFSFGPNGTAASLLVTRDGGAVYVREGGTTRASQTGLNEISAAALGNVRSTATWNLIVTGGDTLTVFDTNIREAVLDRFRFGDLSLGGVSASRLQSPAFEAKSATATDSELLGSNNRDGSQGGFATEPIPPLPDPQTFSPRSARSLRAFGDLPAPAFANGNGSTQTGAAPNSRAAELVYSSGAHWFSVGPDGIRIVDGDRPKVVWPATGSAGALIKGVDAAGGTVAIVDRSQALWCELNQKLTLGCATVLEDPTLPGPIALSPDGHELWVALASGEVRHWHSSAPTVGFTVAAGLTDRRGRIRLLRAFTSELYVATPQAIETYSTTSLENRGKQEAAETRAIERCDDRGTYALLGDQLAYASGGAAFARLTGQPALVSQIACDGRGSLLLRSSRYGSFTQPSPPDVPWGWLALVLLPFGAAWALYLGHQYFTRRGRQREKVAAHGSAISLGLDTDSPLGDIELATEDQRDLVEALFNFLDNEQTKPPLTVGVYGAWGSGKSSIMRMLCEQLQNSERYVTVWFNAWRHHQEDQLGPALLQSIVSEFRRQATAPIRLRSWWSALRYSRKTFYWALALPCVVVPSYIVYTTTQRPLFLTGYLAALVPFWKAVVAPFLRLFTIEPIEAVDKSFRERMSFFQDFNEEFERVVSSLPKGHYLCIFVDDLDRCPPDRVTDVLEALNRLMESQLCFVVLGMDPDMVRRCVEIRYKDLVEAFEEEDPGYARRYGARFLEKLVGMAVTVPPVDPATLKPKIRPKAPPKLWVRLVDGSRRRLDQILVGLAVMVGVAFAFVGWLSDREGVSQAVQQTLAVIHENLDEAAEKKSTEAAEAVPDKAQTPAPAVPTLPPAPEPSPASETKPLDTIERTVLPEATAAAAGASLTASSLSPYPTSRASEYENAKRRNLELLAIAVTASLFGAFLALSRFRQELRVGARAEPVKDSPEFVDGLSHAVLGITNPRALVRHRNLARLTYYLVDQEAARRDGRARETVVRPWTRAFFSVFTSATADPPLTTPAVPHEHGWILDKLLPWLGRVSATDTSSSSPSPNGGASAADGASSNPPPDEPLEPPPDRRH